MSDARDASVNSESEQLESDLGSVEAALDALDADDLDRAEELAASLKVDDVSWADASVESPNRGSSDEV